MKNEQYKAIIDHSPAPLFLCDQEENIVYMNEKLIPFLLYPKEHYIQKSYDYLLDHLSKDVIFLHTQPSNKRSSFLYENRLYFPNLMVSKNGGIGLFICIFDILSRNSSLCNLISYVPCGIFLCEDDDDLTIMSANPSFYELFQHTSQSFANECQDHIGRLMSQEEQNHIHETLQAAYQEHREVLELENHCIRRDGSSIWILVQLQIMTYDNHHILLGSVTDISMRKEMEQKLKMKEARYQIALSQTKDILWDYDIDTRIAQSQGNSDLFHMNSTIADFPDALITHNIITRESSQEWLDMFHKIEADVKKASCMVQILNDDQILWYRITLTRLNPDSKTERKAIGVAEDITSIHAAQQRYLQEGKFRTAIAKDALASYEINVDEDRIVEGIQENNKEMLESVGLQVNCTFSEFLCRWAKQNVHPDDRQLFLDEMSCGTLKNSYAKGKSEITSEYRSYNAFNVMIWCKTTIHLIIDPVTRQLIGFVYVKDIDEEKKEELALVQKSRSDPLTGLANRTVMKEYIENHMKYHDKPNCALMILDVDNFKQINDTFGHAFGDKILVDIAYKLQRVFRKEDLIARFGGDEFVIFLQNINDAAFLYRKAKTVTNELGVIAHKEDQSYPITNSIGISFGPKDGTSFIELFEKADSALYEAKKNGKSCFMVYGDSSVRTGTSDYVNKEWLMDELEEIVYVSDIENYNLIYMNKTGRDLCHVNIDNYHDRKCYEVLQGLDRPCTFCTNSKLRSDRYYIWENENPYLHKSYIVKDKLVTWDGREVRMEIAVDTTNIDSHSKQYKKYSLEHTILNCLQTLNSESNLKKAIEKTLSIIMEFYQGNRSYIIELDRKNGIARNTYEACGKNVLSQQKYLQNIDLNGLPLIFETFNKKQHLVITDIEELKFTYPSEYSYLTQRKVHSLYAVPLPNESGESFTSYIGVDNPDANMDATSLLDSLAMTIANEISRRRMYEALEYNAMHDHLSGLLNRNSYEEYMSSFDRTNGTAIGIITADINGLKQINRENGHYGGDHLIQLVASIMRKHFSDDHLFRLSGDEFVIICEDIGYDEFMHKCSIAESELQLKTKFGVSLGSTWDDEDTDIALMLHHAEERMLISKQLYYNSSSVTNKHHSPQQFNELQRALREGWFQLYLQPKYDARHHTIVSAEALSRIQVPGKDLISPGQYIPMLEKCHLIRYLDFHMLRKICALMEEWIQEGKPLLQISVNFSRQTLLEEHLITHLRQIQDEYQIPFHYIMIEITESLGDMEQNVIATIAKEIARLGFRLSLDDFGAEYANMSILSVLRFDELKLDRSLISRVTLNKANQSIVRCIVDMCEDLHIECVAEGVEQKEQLDLLMELGCFIIQGFYFSRPLPVVEFQRLFHKGS